MPTQKQEVTRENDDALRIRPMVEGDAEVVAKLAGQLGYPSEAEAIRARIRRINGLDLLLVAVQASDRVVGFIQAHRLCILEAGFWVEILGLVVSSGMRRKGIGRRLIAEVEGWAENIGAEAVVVRSNTKRTESHVFYPTVGYEAIKTQAVYQKKLTKSKLKESESAISECETIPQDRVCLLAAGARKNEQELER